MLKFTNQQILTVRRSTGAKLQEHLRENSRRLLLNLRNYGTFAGVFSPENVAVLLVFWNICRKMRGIYFRLRLQLS